MDQSMFFITVLGTSIMAGVLGSLLGLGGGIIVIPVLTLGLGVDIRYATGASIVSVIATSSGATVEHLKESIANLRAGMLLEMATATGAVLGAIATSRVGSKDLYLLFAAVLAYSILAMLRRRHADLVPNLQNDSLSSRLRLGSQYLERSSGRVIRYGVTGVPLALVMMLFAGVISGLLGVGSGTLKVPAMDLAMKLPIKVSTATSNFMIGVTAAAGAAVHYTSGDIVPYIAAPVAIGVLIGAIGGARILGGVQGRAVRFLFIAVLAVVAIQMGAKGLGVQL